jgi:hypothetical protein
MSYDRVSGLETRACVSVEELVVAKGLKDGLWSLRSCSWDLCVLGDRAEVVDRKDGRKGAEEVGDAHVTH